MNTSCLSCSQWCTRACRLLPATHQLQHHWWHCVVGSAGVNTIETGCWGGVTDCPDPLCSLLVTCTASGGPTCQVVLDAVATCQAGSAAKPALIASAHSTMLPKTPPQHRVCPAACPLLHGLPRAQVCMLLACWCCMCCCAQAGPLPTYACPQAAHPMPSSWTCWLSRASCAPT